jgi:hypothetical protein
LINQLSSAAGTNTMATTMTTVHPTPSVDLNCILQSLTTAFANAINAVPQTRTSNQSADVSDHLTQAISNIATQINQQQAASMPTATTSTVETVPEYRPTPIAELERRRRHIQQSTVRSTIKQGNPVGT